METLYCCSNADVTQCFSSKSRTQNSFN